MSSLAPGPAADSRYRPDIDGLRAIAVLAVLGYHYFPRQIPSGFVGVDIFFVISGFLISGLILDDLAENKFSLSGFYARRVRRLFPALLLVLAFSLVIGWLAFFSQEFKALGKHAAGGAAFMANILYWRESGYFDSAAATKPLLHLWSLGIEEQFYICFPLLLGWAWQKGLRTGALIALALAASLTYNFHMRVIDPTAGFYSPLTRFWELLAGAFLASLVRAPASSWPHKAMLKIDARLVSLVYKNCSHSGTLLGTICSVLGFSLVVLAIFAFREARNTWPGYWAVIPVAGAALIIAAGRGAFLNRHIMSHRLAVAVGLISYPLYLWHWPILVSWRLLNGGSLGRHERVLASLLSLALACLTYKLVERPFRFGSRFKALKTIMPAVSLAVTGSAGLFIYAREGLPERGFDPPGYEITAEYDDGCQAYTAMGYKEFSLGRNTNLNLFCRFSGGRGPATVALIGNSYAWSAYHGVEKFNSRIGLNTLLLSKGGVPLLIGTEGESYDTKFNKDRHRELILRAFAVLRRPEIKAVFIFISQYRLPASRAYLQPTVDWLNAAGKKVFLVEAWPALPRDWTAYWPRPVFEFFRPGSIAGLWRELGRTALFNDAQKNYSRILRSIKNATLIDGAWNAFCPAGECLVLHQGRPLYSDYGHLTNYGSEFLAEKVLAPYLAAFGESEGRGSLDRITPRR